MASIFDVAQKAGVSKSTVSRVLNGGSVSPSTQVAVIEAIKKMGYSPNDTARNLARRKTKTVRIVIADVADPYYADIVRGIESHASQNGFDLLLCSSQQDEHREVASLRKLMEKRVDGLLVVSCSSTTAQGTLVSVATDLKARRPIVILERTLPNLKIHTVDIDNVASSEMVVEHLINVGHRRIAHITGPLHTHWGVARLMGYRNALAKRGIPYDENLVSTGDFTYESGYKLAHDLLSKQDAPSAVFAANDVSALGVWKAASELGLLVPERLAIVGFDDIRELTLTGIPLTTIRQPRQQMGTTAMRILLSLIESGVSEEDYSTILPTELVIRGSCGH